MSGNRKIILILALVAVVYFVFLGFGVMSGNDGEEDLPEDDEQAAQWVESSVPSWMKSIDQWLPKPRFDDPNFPVHVTREDRQSVQIPPDDEHTYREAILVHLGGPAVNLRYVPVNPDELPGAQGEAVLEFELRAGAESHSRKSVLFGESGGVLHLGSQGTGTARVGLEQ